MGNVNTITLTDRWNTYVAGGQYPFATFQGLPWLPADLALAAGTGAGQVDQIYQAQLIATTSGASIQLRSGGLSDPIGGAFAPVRVDAMGIYNGGSNAVTVTGAFLNGAIAAGGTASVLLNPGGRLMFGAGASGNGFAVGAGTNSTLTFTGSGGTSPLQIVIAGRSV